MCPPEPTFHTAKAVDVGEATGGSFASLSGGGTPRLDAAHDLYVCSSSATGRTLTVTYGSGATFALPIANGSREVISGKSGAISVDLGTTDSGVVWAYGPAGAFFRGSGLPVGAVLLGPTGNQTITLPDGGAFIVQDDTPGTILSITDAGSTVINSSGTHVILQGGLNVDNPGLITAYDGIATAGLGVSPITGSVDRRIGVASADGSPINLVASTPSATATFKVYWRVFGNTATVTSAIYTLTWTEAGDAETDTVSISAVDTEVTKFKVIQPDNGTAITVQLTTLTGASGTVNLAAWVEQVTT